MIRQSKAKRVKPPWAARHWWLVEDGLSFIACGCNSGDVAAEDRKVSCLSCLRVMLARKKRARKAGAA